MSDDDKFIRLIAEAKNKYMKRHINKPDVVYISSVWLVAVTCKVDSRFCEFDKVLGMHIVYMNTYGLTEALAGTTQRKAGRGFGSNAFRRKK